MREDQDSSADCQGTLEWRATHHYDTQWDGSEQSNGKGRRTALDSRNVGLATWTYDERGRVISATIYSDWAGNYREAYTYDPNGNLTRKGEPDLATDGLNNYDDGDHPHVATA